MPTFDEILKRSSLSDIMTKSSGGLRGEHWDDVVRVVLSVRCPEDIDEKGDVVWDRVRLRELHEPVTEAAVRTWLSTHPAQKALYVLGRLVDVRDPRVITKESLIRWVTELHPDGLADILSESAPADPLELPLYAIPGEELGRALARRKIATPQGWRFAGYLKYATDEARGAYLRDAATVIHPAEVRDLGSWLAPHAAQLAPWIRQAYADALVESAATVTKSSLYDFYIWAALLDAEGVARVLRATVKKAPVFARALVMVASQGFPECAPGLARVLDDSKANRLAALALASFGKAGAEAAKGFLDAQPAKPTKGAPLARLVAGLPVPAMTLWHGVQYTPRRFERDPAVDLRPRLPIDESHRSAPTPLAKIEAAIAERPAPTLLPASGWADLLQIIALDPWLEDVPYAWHRAMERGRLGLGADPGAMQAALDELRWSGYRITHQYAPHEWGVGHLLLWAGAGRDIFHHAIGRFESCRTANVLGAQEQHFGRALKEEAPAWAAPFHALLNHYLVDVRLSRSLGTPPVLARAEKPGAKLALTPPGTDMWILGAVKGASTFTVKLRGSIEVAVDVLAERWTIDALKLSGATPPLERGREITFAFEVAGDRMHFGIDGAAIHGSFQGLPLTVAPVEATAAGEGAEVTRLELLEKYLIAWSEAASSVLVAPEKVQSYTEVAGLRSPAAAHFLAVAAGVLEEEQAALARTALAIMKCDGIEVWQAAAAETPTAEAEAGAEAEAKPSKTKTKTKTTKKKKSAADTSGPARPVAPTEFTVRSFEEVVRAFQDMKLGVKARSKKPAVLRRGQTERGDYEYASFAPEPATEDWNARTAVPFPAVYLSEEPPALDNISYFVDGLADLPALCRKGRGTSARVNWCVKEGSYLVAAMELVPADDDDAIFYEVLGAAWKVEEGWALVLLEGTEEQLLGLIGMRALPARVEWQHADDAVVGSW
jgi:hypothetical protein